MDWRLDSLCTYEDGDIWFSEEEKDILDAKFICKDCPVKRQCLEFALDNKEYNGVWGAASPTELQEAMRIDQDGNAKQYTEPIKCLDCMVESVDIIDRKRSKYQVECRICSLSWEIKRAH